MPLVCSQYDWSGIPGIVVAAPTIAYFDAAYAEKLFEEQWNWKVTEEALEQIRPWAHFLATEHWHATKPWWLGAMS